MARNDQDVVIAVYGVHGQCDLGRHGLLGQTKENIMHLRANGNGEYIASVESLIGRWADRDDIC